MAIASEAIVNYTLHRLKIPRLWNDANRKSRTRESLEFGADPGAKSHFHMAKFTKLKMSFCITKPKIHWLLLKLITLFAYTNASRHAKWSSFRGDFFFCSNDSFKDEKLFGRSFDWRQIWQISICIQAPLCNRTVTFAGNKRLLDTVDVPFATKYETEIETNWKKKHIRKVSFRWNDGAWKGARILCASCYKIQRIEMNERFLITM